MQTTELVLNLWYVMEQRDKLVYAVAGKAYALAGADHEKTRILKLLAATDFLTAQFCPVPQDFYVVAPNGNVPGITTPEILQTYLDAVFAEVFEMLDATLANQFSLVARDPDAQRLRLPEEPLFVLTALVDDGSGRLHAVV